MFGILNTRFQEHFIDMSKEPVFEIFPNETGLTGIQLVPINPSLMILRQHIKKKPHIEVP